MFMKLNNHPWMPMAAILALIAAAFLAAPVFAQDEAPAEPAPDEAPAETIPAEELPAEEAPVLEVIPEGVEVVPTGAEGEALPLASEEAAQVLAGGDPWWKVGTITYRFLTGIGSDTCALVDPTNPYCFMDPNPIQASMAYIMINATAVPTDGKVYVEAGTYTDTTITINGTTGNLGKLKGLIGSLSPTTNLPVAILPNSVITIQNMPGAFLLSGFDIAGNSADGVVRLFNNTGTVTLQDLVVVNSNASGTAAGIYADQSGAITLTRVDSSSNTSNGAYLKNDTGTGAVTITNASFDDNNGTTGAALTIITKGAVTLNNVSVARNDTTGVSITSLKSLLVKNSNFHHNSRDGLNVTTALGTLATVTIENTYLMNNSQDGGYFSLGGTVTFKNVRADNNTRFGTVINTCGSGTCDMAGVGAVTITNATFDNNHKSNTASNFAGLSILAKGAITLNNVSASNNGYYSGAANRSRAYGAWLNNHNPLKPANISITQGVFDGNFWVGLRILTKGSVKLNTISASGNGIPAAPDWQIYGMDIDADEGSGSVTLTSTLGDSFFDNNNGTGIRVFAKGNVALTGKAGGESSSSSNGTGLEGAGIWVDNTAGLGSVTIKNFDVLSNQTYGLRVRSNGAITLDTLNVNNNGVGLETIGADIANNSATTAKSVTIYASNFQSNIGEGLHVYTRGSVTLNGINASNNTSIASNYCGAIIDATSGTGSVTLLGTKGTNYFNNNDDCGLAVYAHGKVSLDTLTVHDNANGNGVYINTTNAGDVIVKKLTSYNNGYAGLNVSAFGNITVDNATVYDNGLMFTVYSGAYLYNAGGTLAKSVTVTRSVFHDIPSWGLVVDSRGLITLNDVSAYDNTLDGGAWLTNNYPESTAGVSVLSSYGDNFFDNNEGDGLYILTNGPVTASKVDSETNEGHGVNVINTSGTGGVTISKGYFASNWGSAIHIQTNGKISVSDVTADTNGTMFGGAGLYLDNNSSPVLEQTVSLLRTVVANQMFGDGIMVITKGTVTLNTVTSFHNSFSGLDVENTTSSKNAGISILSSYGRNEFSDNGSYGLYFSSDGTISISKTDVMLNDGPYGAALINAFGTGSVVITDSNFSSNPNGYGISITTHGKVTWTGGGASYNGTVVAGYGAQIDNSSSLAPMTVNLSKAVFSGNHGDGLHVLANGQITLNKVTADDNYLSGSEYGAYLNNSGWTGGISVLSSYGANEFNGNGEDGLYIHTTGAVVLSKITAELNDRYGIVVDNAEGSSTASVSFTTGSVVQNYLDGIYVESNGAISLVSVNASMNGYLAGTGSGAYLGNTGGTGKAITVSKSIFELNDGDGIFAQSTGVITLNSVESLLNTTFGVNLTNDLGTAKVDVLYSKIHENHSVGVGITSAGAVTISGTQVYQNTAMGIYISNTGGSGNVTITGCNVTKNTNDGMTILSSGVVSIINSKVEANTVYGARMINTADTSGTKGVTVKNSTFSGNIGGYGLRIESHGAVLMTTVKAENNNGEGAYINNLTGTTTGTPIVTLSGTNSFCNNNDDGLVVYGKGVVTLSGITASNNNGRGMYLNTDTGSAINISNATLKQNNQNGIYAISGGAINISGMVVLFNGTTTNYSGAYLDATGHDITIKNSAINANGASGIVAYTGATHTLYLAGVNYFGNDYFGGLVDPDLSFDGHLVLN